jgi:superoxide dismutase
MNDPRGSLVGLRRLRKETQESNTTALGVEIQRLRLEKPGAKWTYREVCAGALLKSQNALKAPWNAHIRLAIDEHNVDIKGRNNLLEKGRLTAKDDPCAELNDQNFELRSQLENALRQISIWEAEASCFGNENQNLKKINARLEAALNQVSAQLDQARNDFRAIAKK